MMKIKYFSAIAASLGLLLVLVNLASAASASPFKDVTEDHPNLQAIVELKNREIIGGYSDGTFKPNKTVNRVEALKIILLGSKITVSDQTGTGGFKDTVKNEWYAKYLLKGIEMKIVQGYNDKTFKPTKAVNLVENLKMLLVANNIDLSKITVSEDPYKDAPKKEWHAKYLQYAKDNKLIDADSDGKIYPDRDMTRARLAEIMYRLIQLKENGKSKTSAMDKMEPSKKDETTTTTVIDPDVQKGIKEPTSPVNPGSSGGGSSAKPEPIFLGIKIEGFAFNLNSMTIGVGTTVKWMNKDSVAHTVTSDSGKFESGLLNNGQTWEYTFKEAGTYEYHCTPHPSMKGTIIVKPANEVPTI